MLAENNVIILGAGFSAPAGIPIQGQLLPKILKKWASPKTANIFLEVPEGRVDLTPVHIEKFRSLTIPLLKQVFGPKDLPRLEEVFTLFDSCIRDRVSLGGLDWTGIASARRALAEVIAAEVTNAPISNRIARNYVGLTDVLIGRKFLRNRSVSVLSLNWDNLLERLILRKSETKIVRTSVSAGFDGTVTIGSKKLKTLKLIKIHGSVDWIRCMHCGVVRSLVKVTSRCLSCGFDVNEESSSGGTYNGYYENYPEVLMITPTYLKELGSYAIQEAWKSAFLELSQAHGLIFVGYSFPEADYHFRQMLLRARKNNWRVTVVTRRQKVQSENVAFRTRYESFFGTEKVKFYWDGVEGAFGSSKVARKILT